MMVSVFFVLFLLIFLSFNSMFASSLQAPVQIKEFGAVTNIDISPVAPHNFAVTAFTRVCWLHFTYFLFIYLKLV